MIELLGLIVVAPGCQELSISQAQCRIGLNSYEIATQEGFRISATALPFEHIGQKMQGLGATGCDIQGTAQVFPCFVNAAKLNTYPGQTIECLAALPPGAEDRRENGLRFSGHLSCHHGPHPVGIAEAFLLLQKRRVGPESGQVIVINP